MKTLYNIFLLVFSISLTSLSTVNAQSTSNDKITETTVKVPGVCKMCKERIEEAAMRSKGVKFAEWNQDSKDLKLIFRNDKITKEEVLGNIALIGHGYNLNPTDSVAYENLPDCCKYNDGVSDH